MSIEPEELEEPEESSETEEDEETLSSFEGQVHISAMDQESLYMHELFQSLQRAGFNERQALNLVGMIINDMSAMGMQVYYSAEDDESEDDSI